MDSDNRWLAAAASRTSPATSAEPVPTGPRFLSAHPGSGASTWAHLLGGTEISSPVSGPFYVVARTTLRGVNDAKPLTPGASAVVLVADAPGKPPAEVARQIRVLEGAARLIRVPWVPALRGMVVVPMTPAVTKVAAKVAAQLNVGGSL